jgi:hypothetical protein
LEKEERQKQTRIMTLIHPCYFPNAQLFSLILQGDIIWEMHDNYQKQTYRNRAYIATDRGQHMLSIPIVHVGNANGRQHYKDVLIDNSYNWQRQHWRTLETAYRTSPFFEYYEDELKPLYDAPHEHLLHLNLKTIQTVCECLQIPFPQAHTQSYELEASGIKDQRYLVNAKKNYGGDLPEYVQVFGDRHGFLPNLSILDLLFNLGPNTTTYLKDTPTLM